MSRPDDFGMRRMLRCPEGNRILTPMEYEKESYMHKHRKSSMDKHRKFTDLVDHVKVMDCSKCGKSIGNSNWIMRRQVSASPFGGWGATTWIDHEKCPTEDEEVDVNDPFFCGD